MYQIASEVSTCIICCTQPIFLSKKERQELAIKLREEQVQAQREKMELERQKRQEYLQQAQG